MQLISGLIAIQPVLVETLYTIAPYCLKTATLQIIGSNNSKFDFFLCLIIVPLPLTNIISMLCMENKYCLNG